MPELEDSGELNMEPILRHILHQVEAEQAEARKLAESLTDKEKAIAGVMQDCTVATELFLTGTRSIAQLFRSKLDEEVVRQAAEGLMANFIERLQGLRVKLSKEATELAKD